MQPPPPFEMPGGPPRRKKSALPWIIVGGVLVCCVGPIVAIGGLTMFGLKTGVPLIECQAQFQGIGGALGKYVAAHDGKLPKAATWQTDIAKYYDDALPPQKEGGPFKIPQGNETFGCGSSPRTAVMFNSAYSEKTLTGIKDPEAILVFESPGTPGMNLSGPYKDPGKASSPEVFGNHRGWFAVNAMLAPVAVIDGRQTTSTSGGGFRSRRSGSNP